MRRQGARKTVCGHWKTLTMIGAIALDGIRGFMTIESGTGVEVFDSFVRNELIPNLRAGDIVVMDNLNVHRNPGVVSAIKKVGADVLYILPYSPEFKPIEKMWSKLKDIIRRAETLCVDTFNKAVANAMRQISNHDIAAWTLHAGYCSSRSV